jgi:hypothetical protein
MTQRSVNLIKSLSRGPCSCQYEKDSFSVTWDPTMGKTNYAGDLGPRTQQCTRCRAREALEADGIEYDKDDKFSWDTVTKFMGDGATAVKTLGEGVVVITGSVYHNPLR